MVFNVMRDRRFVAEHRGGPLTKQQHCLLMAWAVRCAEHILPYYCQPIDPRLSNALKVAKDWPIGKASVGDAMKAARNILVLARELSDPTAILVARSIGQAVSTAHMADHSLGAAWYALKAAKSVGCSVEAELIWQNRQLPAEVKELVLSARSAPKFQTKSLRS
jgi:hypothetical protein